jgi:hypothetical protein
VSLDSLAGIDGSRRQDRHPCLQLDADVDKRSVVGSGKDRWHGDGENRSGQVGEWRLSEITAPLVARQARAVLRRSLRQPA